MTAVATVPAIPFASNIIALQTPADRRAFDRALLDYERARDMFDGSDESSEALERVDVALDRILATESPDPAAFAKKMLVLEREYGRDWQRRHIDWLLADAGALNPN